MSLLVKNARLIVTPNKVLENKSIYVEDGRIIEFSKQEADIVIDARNKAVLPGLINAHTHIAMNFLRGIAEDKPLKAWLEQDIWPREKKINAELVYYSSLLGIAEALLSGTTGFVDMYFFEEEVAKAAEKLGARTWLGYGMIDLFDEEKREEEIKKMENFVNFVEKMKNPLIKPIVTPHAPYTCSSELLTYAHEFAKEKGLIFHIHVNETEQEVKQALKSFGKAPVSYLSELGVVDEFFLGAHGVWLSREEVRILAEARASIVHNPTSNLKLGSGIAPVRDYIEHGLNIALGTDGEASNNDLDLFEEIRLMVLLQKLRDVTFPSIEALKAATVNGARALHFEGGVIEENAPADLVIIDLTKIHFQPIYNKYQLVNNIIFNAKGSDVTHVIVNGLLRVVKGKLVNEKIVETAKEKIVELVRKLEII